MLTTKDKKFLEKIINKLDNSKENDKINNYPLLEKGFTNEDIYSGVEVLLSKKITMSSITKKFEKAFARFVGSRYALMVNSGSSANLLSAFALLNPKKKNRLRPGDLFAIPALCWSTSLWPFVQAGLRPKFLDVDIKTFCLDDQLIKKEKNLKAIVNIHILGNCSNILQIQKFAKKNNLFLVEDTCEALGSKYKSKFLGTFGDFGTYSFYYSHQITSGEGGMVVCKNKDDYELIHSMRAHGWDRDLTKNIKKNFNFINSGFNLRPLDLTAAIGLSQLRRLNKMIKVRGKNRKLIINTLKNSRNWNNQFSFFEPNNNLKPSWFGLPLLINSKYLNYKKKYLDYLNASGVETRQILSGNFLNQPSAKLYKFNKKINKFKNSQDIEDRGFFIGLPTKEISRNKLDFLTEKLLKI